MTAKSQRDLDIVRRHAGGEPLTVLAYHYGLSVARVQQITGRTRKLAEGPPLVKLLQRQRGRLTLAGMVQAFPLPERLRDPAMLRAYCILNHVAFAHEVEDQSCTWSDRHRIARLSLAEATLQREIASAKQEAAHAPAYKPGALCWDDDN